MLTNQSDSAVLSMLRGFTPLDDIRNWWRGMSREEHSLKISHTLGLAACAVIVVVGLPQIAHRAETQRSDAALRTEARNLSLAVRVSIHNGSDIGQAAGLQSKNIGWRGRLQEAVAQGPETVQQLAVQRARDADAVASLAAFTHDDYDRAKEEIAQRRCLAEAIYYEARSENGRGQLAVAEVVLNRVADVRYPKTVCGVVYQGSRLSTGCQFTFTCDGSLRHKPRGAAWREAQAVAMHSLLKLSAPVTHNATHYHTHAVNPIWRAGLVQTNNIGSHVFYRFPQGPEWGVARARLAEERASRAISRNVDVATVAVGAGDSFASGAVAIAGPS